MPRDFLMDALNFSSGLGWGTVREKGSWHKGGWEWFSLFPRAQGFSPALDSSHRSKPSAVA